MVKQIRDFVLRIVAGANIATILAMLLVGYSDRISPVGHPFIAVAGLAFPAFLCINLAFLVFWLCVRKRWALIPVAGLVACYGPVHVYSPLSVGRDAPEGAIKVLSYNVYGYDNLSGDNAAVTIAEYLVKQNADIVCLQEATTSTWELERLDSVLSPVYHYNDSSRTHNNGDDMWLYSKYPVVRKENISYPSQTNHSTAFWLKVDKDTVIFIGNHFESIGLSDEDKSRYKTLVKGGLASDTAKAESRLLISKIGEASARRAPQAEAVAKYVSEHAGRSIILCGDFNDSPISYCRHTLAQYLNDCYVDAGNGPGISYHCNGFYFRIDHIMCSDDWTPYDATVDRSIKVSDHYPIYCWLKRRQNT